MIENIKKFIQQSLAENNDQRTNSYLKEYEGLNVSVSFGQGRRAFISWISFCGKNQTTTNGIYPVLLFYRTLSNPLLILSYGVSATNIPQQKWPQQILNGAETIADFFQWNNITNAPDKYNTSYVRKYYFVDRLDYNDLLNNLNSLIKEYKLLLGQSTLATSQSSYMESPLQRILYGAPGTGKSYSVKGTIKNHCGEELDMEDKRVFRTTFHPDYDYAQFVGCYKPTKSSNRILSQAELVKVFNDMDKTESYYLSKIGYQYWESFEKIDASEFLKACGKDTQGQGLKTGIELGKKFRKDTDKITYEFVPQVFTQALVKAYKNLDESVYLVIEEINRGNCAQIFGDIFQLLDRNSETGVSEYSINVDEDLRKYLEEKCPAAIKDGKIKLPANFNIIATMNTSDQSLFPMDSAFKRRWDWECVAIKNENKEWTIKIDEKNNVDWWEFLEKINEEISDFTTSEDKQLGYYFCKPDIDQRTISANKFVGKVIFYLWNDLFKDYGFEHNCCKDAKGKTVLFAKFYDSAKTENGAPVVNTDVLKNFFSKLNPEWIKKNPQEEKIEEQ